MEKVYRKDEKGRYYSVGYNDVVDLPGGIWLVKSNPSSKSVTSMVWKVGDVKRPVDVVTHASLQAMERELVNYIHKLHLKLRVKKVNQSKMEIQRIKRRLQTIEKELEKVRDYSAQADGWQTQRFSKKSRKYDYLAMEKFELRRKLEELEDESKRP